MTTEQNPKLPRSFLFEKEGDYRACQQCGWAPPRVGFPWGAAGGLWDGTGLTAAGVIKGHFASWKLGWNK